ncbi:MAG: hypothetical protein ACOX66_07585 [Oscillospiraceae bacterium]
MNGEEMIETLTADPLGRLRWRICREFGIFPGSHAARRMSDRKVLEYGAQMVLDRRERRGLAQLEAGRNSGFDETKFCELAEGRTP